MVIKNKSTGKEYPTTKEKWDSFGANQRLFSIVDPTDSGAPADQNIENVGPRKVLARPVTGNKTGDANTQKGSAKNQNSRKK